MSDDDIAALNSLQEPPSTSLTGAPRAIYEAAKARVAGWDPIPPKKEET